MSDSVRPHRPQPTRLPRPWDSPGKNTGVGWHFLLQCIKVKNESEVAQSFPTLSDPMDCSLPGSSIHGIFQARVLEWGAIAFSMYIYSEILFSLQVVEFCHATTWVNLEYVMLSEINTAWFYLYVISKVIKLIEAESRIVIARDRREEEMGSCC